MNLCAALPMLEFERSGKTFIARDHDDQHVLLFAFDQERMKDLAGRLVVEIGAANH